MWIRGLDLQIIDGPALCETTLDQLLRLRARFLALKPHVTAEADRAAVASWLRTPGTTIAVGRDRDGAVQTFIDMNSRVFEHGGQRHLVCYGNYVFAAQEYRGHPAYTLGNAWNLYTHCRRGRTVSRVVWTGASYPTSFVVGARTFARFWATREPDAPRQLVALLDVAAPSLFGASWLAEERLVVMRTLPGPHEPRSAAGRAALARYERCNPRWREGYGVLFGVPIDLANLVGVVRRLLALSR